MYVETSLYEHFRHEKTASVVLAVVYRVLLVWNSEKWGKDVLHKLFSLNVVNLPKGNLTSNDNIILEGPLMQ